MCLLTVFWTQAESLRLWWEVEDYSMLEVQHVRRPGRRTMLLFAGWWDRRLRLVASGASVPIVQPECRVPSNSLVYSRGWKDLHVSRHNLKVTRCGTHSQCSESRMWLVMWSYFLRPHTVLAAAFITDWSLSVRFAGVPASRQLQ